MIKISLLVKARESGDEEEFKRLWEEALKDLGENLKKLKQTNEGTTEEEIILKTLEDCKLKLKVQKQPKFAVMAIKILQDFSKRHNINLPKVQLPQINWRNESSLYFFFFYD